MDKKIALFVCAGCGIGEALDPEKLLDRAAPQTSFVCREVHPFLCGPEGVWLIQKAVREKGANTLVIGACSPRVKTGAFSFPECLVERVNLREQVVWPHAGLESAEKAGGPGGQVQLLAEDALRMGLARAAKAGRPETFRPASPCRGILVIGGGVTGLSAALDAAQAGFDATIVEKENRLGGWAARMRQQIPFTHPFRVLASPVAGAKIREVTNHPRIRVLTSTRVARIAGQPGDFTVTLGESQEKFGAIVLAAGWVPCQPAQGEFRHLGLGSAPDVITNAAFERMAARGRVIRPSNGAPARNVVFVQSPGQGQDMDFPYGSSVTSLVALKHALYVRSDWPDGRAYVLHQHIRASGFLENFFESVREDPGVFLALADVTQVLAQDGHLVVEARDALLGREIAIKADLVVLGLGMVPATRDDPVLHLAYARGPGLMDTAQCGGHVGSDFICFPYETRRTGIYAAGCVRRAMTVEECAEDASGAALKAIQSIESLARGLAVHPRSGQGSHPRFFLERCTLCGRCIKECPFGALDDDGKGLPVHNPARCRGCGTCMGACPERAVQFADFHIDSVGSQIRSIRVPSLEDTDEPPPRVLALVCENDAYPALDLAGARGLSYSADVRFVPVRCLGSVNVVWIKDALAAGMDGVILIGCKHGPGYQCHFINGSELADVRVKNMAEALVSLALEPERVQQIELSMDEFYKLPEILNGFVQRIRALGPNPFKGL